MASTAAESLGGKPVSQQSYSFDDNEGSSVLGRIKSALPSIPRVRFGRKYNPYAAASLDAWESADQQRERQKQQQRQAKNKAGALKTSSSQSLTPPLHDLLLRCEHGKSTSLLSLRDTRRAGRLGQTRAALDAVTVACTLMGLRHLVPVLVELLPTVPKTWEDVAVLLPQLGTALTTSVDTWAYYALVAAFLAFFTNHALVASQATAACQETGNDVKAATRYAQLYLRLVAARTVDKHIPQRMQDAAAAQFRDVLQTKRLQTFVMYTLSALIVMTIPVLLPIVRTLMESLVSIVSLPAWKTGWPIPWSEIGSSVSEIAKTTMTTVQDLAKGDIQAMLHNPLSHVFQISIFVTLVLVACLPMLEHGRPIDPVVEDDEEDETTTAAFGNVDNLANLGVSSASRLALLSKTGAMEGALERWRSALQPKIPTVFAKASLQSMLRLAGYTFLSLLILALPVGTFVKFRPQSSSVGPSTLAPIRWDSMLDVSLLLVFAGGLLLNAVGKAVTLSEVQPHAKSFLLSLVGTVQEASSSPQPARTPLEGGHSSTNRGFHVMDLWAAHTSKRAWAVRGANLDCQYGQVVMILGDDGCGKTRLLTALAETMVGPPRDSRTTNKVRGVVSLGGMEVTRWDNALLKKRIGLVLNDVRTVADFAEFLSGLTLEEILDPTDGSLQSNPSQAREQRAMNTALQVSWVGVIRRDYSPSRLTFSW